MKTILLILIISFINLKAEDTLNLKDESYNDWKFGVHIFDTMLQDYTGENAIDMFNFGGGVYTEKHIDSLLNRKLSMVISLQYINLRVGVSRFVDEPNSRNSNEIIYKERNHYIQLPVYLSYDLYKTKSTNNIHKLLIGGYGGYLFNSDLDDAIEDDIFQINNYNRFDSGLCLGWRCVATDYDNLDLYALFYYSLTNKLKEGHDMRNCSLNFGMSFEF